MLCMQAKLVERDRKLVGRRPGICRCIGRNASVESTDKIGSAAMLVACAP